MGNDSHGTTEWKYASSKSNHKQNLQDLGKGEAMATGTRMGG